MATAESNLIWSTWDHSSAGYRSPAWWIVSSLSSFFTSCPPWIPHDQWDTSLALYFHVWNIYQFAKPEHLPLSCWTGKCLSADHLLMGFWNSMQYYPFNLSSLTINLQAYLSCLAQGHFISIHGFPFTFWLMWENTRKQEEHSFCKYWCVQNRWLPLLLH